MRLHSLYELLDGLNRDALEQCFRDKETLLWQRDTRHVLISEDLHAEGLARSSRPFSLPMCERIKVLVVQAVAIKLHCSATVQRCIHNPSVLSGQIQLWPRGAISASSVPRRAIDHGDDLLAIHEVWESCDSRRALRSTKKSRTTRAKWRLETQRIDHARSRRRTTDGNRKPSPANGTLHWVNPCLMVANDSYS